VIVGAICYPLGVASCSVVPDLQSDLCLSSLSSTPPAFERWVPASPPCTPLHLSERWLPLSRAAETPSQLLLGGRSHQPTGLVGRFINIAPILLHGGCSIQASAAPTHDDWWLSCVQSELLPAASW
jgi:hypothetical protein